MFILHCRVTHYWISELHEILTDCQERERGGEEKRALPLISPVSLSKVNVNLNNVLHLNVIIMFVVVCGSASE